MTEAIRSKRLGEIELLVEAYEGSGMAVSEFSDEFFRSVQLIVNKGVPARELRLSTRVPAKRFEDAVAEDFGD